MTRWCDYLARRESRKRARENKAKWVPHLSQMSNEEIKLELLTSSHITDSYRYQLEIELEIRRNRRTNRLIVVTLVFSAMSAVLAFVGLLWR